MNRAHEGDSTRPPAESFGLTPAATPRGNRAAPWDRDREACKGRKHGRTRLQPHEALPQGPSPATTGSTRPSSPTTGSPSSPST